MTAFFFDSSALVKRYISEQGTAWVTSITHPTSGNSVYVARVTGVEVVSAITRTGRRGGPFALYAPVAISDFRHDFTNAYLVVELSPWLATRAMDIAEAHALRGYDAIQLASAVEVNNRRASRGLGQLTFVCADTALNAAATAAGLAVEDPNNYP